MAAIRSGSVYMESVVNFRDVGKTINLYLGQRLLREGVFYRSARLDDASASDKKVIREDLGIKTIVDLRTETERLKQAEKRQRNAQQLSAQPPRIDGVEYHEVKVSGRPLERFFLSQLSWWGFVSFFFFFFISGYRIRAINIISREVLLPRGLAGLTRDTLDQSGGEICVALSLYADAQSLPSVVHCTQGKDRTGLVCALMLGILGVSIAAIEHDYSLTDLALEADREERLAEIREIGLTEDWGSTSKNLITDMYGHIDQKHGGLERYLDSIGFGDDKRRQARESLLY